MRNDLRLGVRAINEAVNLDRESVRRIVTEELQMRKICAKVVPKVLSHEQKQCRKELCTEILERIYDDPNLLDLVITFDKTWILKQRDNPCGGSA